MGLLNTTTTHQKLPFQKNITNITTPGRCDLDNWTTRDKQQKLTTADHENNDNALK